MTTLVVYGEKVHLYSCQDYSKQIHCDESERIQEGYSVEGEYRKIFDVEGKPRFINDGNNTSILLRTNKAVNSNLNLSVFTVQLSIKSVKDEPLAGHIISHTDNKNKKGWYVGGKLNETASVLTFAVTQSNGSTISTKEMPIAYNEFVNVIATFNGDNLTAYKNGELISVISYDGNFDPFVDLPLSLGTSAYCFSCNRWSGYINDVKVYNVSLSAEDITGSRNLDN